MIRISDIDSEIDNEDYDDLSDDNSESDDSVSDEVNETDETEQSGSDSDNEAQLIYTSKNRQIQWSSKNIERRRGRARRQNIVHELEGPAPHVRPQELSDSVDYFLTHELLEMAVRYTNQEAERINDDWDPVSQEELRAFCGVLYLIGVLKSGRERLRDFWDGNFGQKSIIATISRKRFLDILRYLRFDDKTTRAQRKQNDRLAPIREFWTIFLRNCRQNIIPSPFLCVDEQLVPTRGRCPIRVYMPNKPSKYGVKVWVLADVGTGYFVDGDIYLRRRNGEAPERNQGARVVIQLCRRFYNSGRNVTFDRFFSSIPLVTLLYMNGLTCIGTLNKGKGEIPPQFKSRRPLNETLFGYHDNIQLASYMAKQTKVVLTISTFHDSDHVNPDVSDKPDSILDYNQTKYAVDKIDQMVNTFTVRRKIRRWPALLFFNILDLCALNGYITWVLRNPDWKLHQKPHRRSIYLKELALQMMTPWMQRRKETQPKGANQPQIKKARMTFEMPDPEPILPPIANRVRGRCHLCNVERRMYTTCVRCNKHVCKEHYRCVCANCL